MICSRCGAENPEEVTFCTKCGEALAKPLNKPEKMDPVKKKRILRIVAALVALVVLASVLVMLFQGDEAENAVEDLCDSLLRMDLSSALGMLPPAALTYLSDNMNLDHLKYEIIRSEKLDDDYVQNIDERYAMKFGTEDGYIESACVVYLRAAVSGKSLSRDEIPLIMVEVDGEWYLDPLTTSSEIDEADWDQAMIQPSITWN